MLDRASFQQRRQTSLDDLQWHPEYCTQRVDRQQARELQHPSPVDLSQQQCEDSLSLPPEQHPRWRVSDVEADVALVLESHRPTSFR
jgi:hypothetical protein